MFPELMFSPNSPINLRRYFAQTLLIHQGTVFKPPWSIVLRRPLQSDPLHFFGASRVHAYQAYSHNKSVQRRARMLFILTSLRRFVVMDRPVGIDSAVIRIILADSQVVYRVGILQVLTSETDMRVVAQANTLAGLHRAVERYFSQSPTQRASTSAIILLEGNMISATVDAISELVRRAPQVKIIAQFDERDESNTVELYRRGVRGIIPRSISPDLLVKCVRKIAAGEVWIDTQSVDWVIEASRSREAEPPRPRTQLRLSPKELAIITCITQGKRNKEIAHQLGTTEQVIKNYLRRVYDKLGVSDRLELAFYALHHQLNKKVSDSGVLRGASIPVPDIQGNPNGSFKG
jgi:two-component system, NarL family, nitrate/nitrite response regulator NarL